jgi:hypothetical protein
MKRKRSSKKFECLSNPHHPVFLAFARTNQKEVVFEINVHNPQTETLHETKPASIHELSHKEIGAIEER